MACNDQARRRSGLLFHLYHHHDLERLAELLGALLSRSPAGPLATETVLVPNRGVGRWLQMKLAESDGVAANLNFLLPAKFFWRLLSSSLPASPDSSAYERENLRWHLYAMLPELAESIPRVGHYLDGKPTELRRWQLAEQLADVFDQYLIYRREMLAAWETGEGEDRAPADWQAPLWRALVARLGERHRARLLTEFTQGLEESADSLDRQAWPERLYCFGLGNLPPDYLRLLYGLGREVSVHYLLPNPSAEYWGDIDSRKVSLSLDPSADSIPGEDAVAGGHPLLASLGRPARDFLRVLYSDELSAIHEPELGEALAYRPPEGDALLHRLQRGIIRMDAAADQSDDAGPDASLQIHACHGPLREVQVLHDQILDRLSADESLQPRDILVMLPDVARYAPAIHAVFGGEEGAHALPYTVSDQARLSTHPIARSVHELLELPLSRWTASEVMGLASVPAVMRRFGLDGADLDSLSQWIAAAGVRWGLDAGTRQAAGAGDWEQNSWRFGLDRLLLGLAQADDDRLTADVAPWSELEGGGTAALGKLWWLLERLRHWRDTLAEPASAADWRERLNAMLDDLFAPDREEPQETMAMAMVHEALQVLGTADDNLGGDTLLSWEAVREALGQALDDSGERQPFLGAGITFCGLVPLRAVPFRMVAILGMNDGDFPRQDRNRSFNLIRRFPRLGDASTRDDDRLLFLQAVMAARDTFYLSFTGQDVRSGEELEPSPVVGELLDFLHGHYLRALDRKAAHQRLITHQPMQPFSRRYFDAGEEERVFTFQGEWLAGTRAQFGDRTTAPHFVDGSRARPPTETTVGLADLARFVDHPPRYFFRECLHLALDSKESLLEDEEPRRVDGLTAHQLRRELFQRACEDGPLTPEPDALIRARGVLPPPPLDRPEYRALVEDVNALLPAWQAWHDNGDPAEAVDIDLRLGEHRLRGVVRDVFPDGLRRIQVGKLGTRHRLAFWLDYLALRAAGHDGRLQCAGLAEGSLSVMAAELSREAAREQLERWLDLHHEGRQHPLPFLPSLGGRFAEEQSPAHTKEPKSPDEALESRNGYLANTWTPAWELSDPWFRLVLAPAPYFLGAEAESSDFCRVAEAICGPLTAHLIPADEAPGTEGEAT
ncbi:exodeoxyribonuclease V subunit gamma [Natronospira bacteriovora]|uniref:RecBCD enzyme subunit RecC n=1 Tax=Natronospira bacteriovora TaxID=3069753 RepID=A0ABU0W4M6_9GAMM|nr:exodeoxyribonuclease V subunit gamma [Natronospira sp. AB-CW4]MDQ2068975.1 exodeoxyribonuclease V subunit gamma [Natronospira sp. AB-CW4]